MDNDLPYGNNGVVSATECTGLVQDINTDETETESYKEIYDIPLKVNEISVKKENEKQGKKKNGNR